MSGLEIPGEKVVLREFADHHLHDPAYFAWLRQPDLMIAIDRVEYLLPLRFAEVEAYVQRVWASATDGFFAIHRRSDDRFVGTVRLHSLDWRNRYGEIGILIGDPSARGQGLSPDAVGALCRYAFDTLGLRRLGADTGAFNLPMQRCFERLGFRIEGRLRRHMPYRGDHVDRLLFGLFPEELRYPGQA